MSSAAGGYGGGAGSGAEPHCHGHGHGDYMLHHHAQHVAAQQLYHVPQHSRREKLRFPPDDSPPHASASAAHQQQQHAAVAWPPPPPPAFYSYASSSTSSYSPHSPTLAQAQLVVAHGLATPLSSQIPTQNFALSLSSSSSNPPPAPTPQPRRAHAAAPSAPFGPFTGYAAVLGRSRFLIPAEKLLEEICDVGGAASHVDRSVSDDGLLDADPMEAIDHDMDGADRAASDAGPISGAEQQWKKTRLISMMEEVCKRYRLYYQQVQTVINSFETVAGFSNAAPFAAMALRAMARHFKCLKSMILSQLRNTTKAAAGKESLSKDIVLFGLAGGSAAALQRASSVAAFGQPHNIWRPQRGLPERAVSVLRAWLFEHFLHPGGAGQEIQGGPVAGISAANPPSGARQHDPSAYARHRAQLLLLELHRRPNCAARTPRNGAPSPSMPSPTGAPHPRSDAVAADRAVVALSRCRRAGARAHAANLRSILARSCTTHLLSRRAAPARNAAMAGATHAPRRTGTRRCSPHRSHTCAASAHLRGRCAHEPNAAKGHAPTGATPPTPTAMAPLAGLLPSLSLHSLSNFSRDEDEQMTNERRRRPSL